MKFSVSMLLAALLLVGCTSVPYAPESMESVSKEFVAGPDVGKIYVVRPSALTGNAILLSPLVDQRVTGSLEPGSFLVTEEQPGVHQVAVMAKENVSAVSVTVEAGKLYFIMTKSVMGMWAPRASVELIDEEEGRRLVMGATQVLTLNQLTTTEPADRTFVNSHPSREPERYKGLSQ